MMVCSREDKAACAQIWKQFSGKDTRPEEWNDKAIQALAELVGEVRNCSSNMNHIPRPTFRPTPTWLLKQAIRPLKDFLFGGTASYETCRTARYWQYKDAIETSLQLGE